MEFKAAQYIDRTRVRTRFRLPGAGQINVDAPLGRSKITPASSQIALGGPENVSFQNACGYRHDVRALGTAPQVDDQVSQGPGSVEQMARPKHCLDDERP